DVAAGLAKGGVDYMTEVDGDSYALDLQWRPVSGRWLRADQEPDADELIERSVEIAGSAARMLAPTDNLIQVALHTAKHSYCRAPGFRLHLDVDRLVHSIPLDWHAVVEATRRLGVATPVFLSLSVPRGLFGTPVPDRVLAALAPRSTRRRLLYRWLSAVSVFEPGRPKFTRLGQLAFHTALADGAGGVWRTAFPPRAEMRDRHRVGAGTPALVLGYGRRLAEVVLRYQA
ncbi:MAG TPA: nucleotidyltransferase family protein, partial [Candidatus Binatus sp.]|nr:nucleotidyltransferase family protein [Candidatus Binatus sp.]